MDGRQHAGALTRTHASVGCVLSADDGLLDTLVDLTCSLADRLAEVGGVA